MSQAIAGKLDKEKSMFTLILLFCILFIVCLLVSETSKTVSFLGRVSNFDKKKCKKDFKQF